MSVQDAFERIVASLHEATFDAARWRETSGLIDEAYQARGNILVFGDESSRATSKSSSRCCAIAEGGTRSGSASTSTSITAWTNGSRD